VIPRSVPGTRTRRSHSRRCRAVCQGDQRAPHVRQLAVDDVGHAAATAWRAALRRAQDAATGASWVVGLTQAGQAELAGDRPAGSDRDNAALRWLVAALKPRIPDGLDAGDAPRIAGDLGPAPALLVLSQDQPVTACHWFHADGCARRVKALTEFAGELVGCQQQGGHRQEATVLRIWLLRPVLTWLRRRSGIAGTTRLLVTAHVLIVTPSWPGVTRLPQAGRGAQLMRANPN
jgi:hypothetical protein